MQIPQMRAKGSLYTERESSDGELLTKIGQCENVKLHPLNSKGWTLIRLTSAVSLLPEPEIHAEVYEYNLLFRKGRGSHFLLVAQHGAVIAHTLRLSEMAAALYTPIVDIQGLVRLLADSPTTYTLSAVHSNVEGYGQSLRNISFYGLDVGEALLFREILPRTVPYRVTLNEVPHQSEVINISNAGGISFTTTRGEAGLREVDSALGFLSRNGFLRWEVE